MHLLSRRIFNKSVTQPRCAFMGSIINWSRKALSLGNNREILNNYLGVDLTYLVSARRIKCIDYSCSAYPPIENIRTCYKRYCVV